MSPKFKYNEIALIDKGSLKAVKVGIRFDSKVTNKRRNKSGISYYIEGYELRDWCYEEELKKLRFYHKILIWIFKRKVLNFNS